MSLVSMVDSLRDWLKDDPFLTGFGRYLLYSRDGGYLLAVILAVLLPLARTLLRDYLFEVIKDY